MSFEIEAVSTSPTRRLPHHALAMFRMEQPQPFDPSMLGLPTRLPTCNRGGGGTSAPPPRAAHYARTQIVPTQGLQQQQQHQRQQQQVYIDEAYGYGENESLIDRRSEARRGGLDLPSSLTLCAAVALWSVILGVVFIM